MEQLYSKQILLKKLRENNLPYSYPSLLRYEKKGIIQKPLGMIHYSDRSWRFYSTVEINKIVVLIRKYLKE